MTYFATLWFAGAVVMQLGHPGQTIQECEYLAKTMMQDIDVAYENQETLGNLATSMFPENKFEVTCETAVYEIDESYSK